MIKEERSISEAETLVRRVLSHFDEKNPDERNVRSAAVKIVRAVSGVQIRELEDA